MKAMFSRLSQVFMENRYLLVLVCLIILVAGASALQSLPRTEDPVITNRNPLIITPFPGASAERVETLVTEKIEDALEEVSEIKEIKSVSRAGISIVAIELADSITAGTNQEVFSLIRDKLSGAEAAFIPGVGKPFFDDKRGAVAYTLVAALTWDQDTQPRLGILSRLAEDLADQIRTLPGTDLVRIYGEAREEITVSIDRDELAALAMTSADVAARLSAADAKRPAGVWRGGQSDLLIEVSGELDSLQRIHRIPLKESDDGGLVRLGDLARVEKRWQEPPAEVALTDGRRAVFVGARVQADQQIDRWMPSVYDIIDDYRHRSGDAISIEIVFDQSIYTNQRLASLANNLLLGALVAVGVVLVIMGWRAALLVGAALPLVAALTLFILSTTGEALHQISIFGMIVALGLLLDNAIVVVDDIFLRLAEGRGRRDAVIAVVGHLFVPLAASTLTTVLAFMPILLLDGNIGDFIGSIGSSVIIALVCAFVVATTIIAALTGLFGSRQMDSTWWRSGVSHPAFSAVFNRCLTWGLHHPLAAIAVTALLPAIGFALIPTMGNQFFPRVDRNMFEIRLWLPGEAAIGNTRNAAVDIEAVMRKSAEVKHVHWLIGGSFPTVYYNRVMKQDRSDHYAHAIITTKDSAAVKHLIPGLQKTLDDRFPSVQMVVNQFAQGPPAEADVEFRITGPSIATLQEIGDKVRLLLAEHPDVLHTQVTMARGEPKLWVEADENEARLAGLTLSDISDQLLGSLEGSIGGSVLEGLEEMPVRIRYDDENRRHLGDIRSINVTRRSGSTEWVPIAALGDMAIRPDIGGITRQNGVRVNTIRGFVRNDALPIDVTRAVAARIDREGLTLPAGYRIEIGGESEEQAQAIHNLTLYLPVLIALMVTTVILSFRSVSMAILLAANAFLAAGFGMLATGLAGFPVSFNTIIGTVGLIGLAFNDSIVVLAAIHADPKARAGDVAAMTRAVAGTARHLLATTFTTIGSFLPLLIFVGGDFWPPLAIVLAGGVGGATLLAAGFVPAAYRLMPVDRTAAGVREQAGAGSARHGAIEHAGHSV